MARTSTAAAEIATKKEQRHNKRMKAKNTAQATEGNYHSIPLHSTGYIVVIFQLPGTATLATATKEFSNNLNEFAYQIELAQRRDLIEMLLLSALEFSPYDM